MSGDKILSQEEALKLIQKLQMKYGAESELVMQKIAKDIALYGHLSHETKLAKKALKNKILAEKNGDLNEQKD